MMTEDEDIKFTPSELFWISIKGIIGGLGIGALFGIVWDIIEKY
jgi:hypothetical protein